MVQLVNGNGDHVHDETKVEDMLGDYNLKKFKHFVEMIDGYNSEIIMLLLWGIMNRVMKAVMMMIVFLVMISLVI